MPFSSPLRLFPRPCFRLPKAAAIEFQKHCTFSPALVFNQSVNKVVGAAPTKIWSRIRRIKLITIHWNYWFSAKWCDFVEKSDLLRATSPKWLIFRRFRRLWCSFASILSLWDVFESFSSTIEYQTGLNFLKENDFLNQHSELWKSFHKKKKFLYSYICDLEHFQMISLRTVVLGWWDKLMWWFLWYSTYNEQWNGRSIYQEEWITWYRLKSYETFHNFLHRKLID